MQQLECFYTIRMIGVRSMKRNNGQSLEMRDILHETLVKFSHHENIPLPESFDLREFEKNCPIDLQLYTCINSQNGNSKQL